MDEKNSGEGVLSDTDDSPDSDDDSSSEEEEDNKEVEDNKEKEVEVEAVLGEIYYCKPDPPDEINEENNDPAPQPESTSTPPLNPSDNDPLSEDVQVVQPQLGSISNPPPLVYLPDYVVLPDDDYQFYKKKPNLVATLTGPEKTEYELRMNEEEKKGSSSSSSSSSSS